MIRVLIADDSAFMRKVLSDLFTAASGFNVRRGNIGNRTSNVEKKQEEPVLKRISIPECKNVEAIRK